MYSQVARSAAGSLHAFCMAAAAAARARAMMARAQTLERRKGRKARAPPSRLS